MGFQILGLGGLYTVEQRLGSGSRMKTLITLEYR